MPRPDHATAPPAPPRNDIDVVRWASCRNCKAPIARTDSWFDVDGTRPWCTTCVELRREGQA